jgi:hypothetical protein
VSIPALIEGLERPEYLVASRDMNCAIDAQGMRCWGRVNDEAEPVAITIPGLGERPRRLFQMTDGACAQLSGGAIWCFGKSRQGSLGMFLNTGLLVLTAMPAWGKPQQIAGAHFGYYNDDPERFEHCTDGDQDIENDACWGHACALGQDGTVSCAGSNFYGQGGQPTDQPALLSPTSIQGLTEVVELAAGGYHTCALKTEGSVFCWGYNGYGQVGLTPNLEQTAVPTPTRVDGLDGVVAIAAGSHHTCALVGADTVKCWGYNRWYQLGNHSNDPNHIPQVVQDLLVGYAPVFTSQPTQPQTIVPNETYRYEVVATDLDNHPIFFTSRCHHAGLPANPVESFVENGAGDPNQTAVFTFLSGELSNYTCTLTATDSSGRATNQVFAIAVNGP